MNCKRIVIKGYEELKTQDTPYLSYFMREAQFAHRNGLIEFTDFFNGCKVAISYYKKDIAYKYNKRLTENDWALHSYNQKLSNGESIDENGKLIQDQIDYIESEKEFIKEKGYINNTDYCCLVTEFGDITDKPYEVEYNLYYSEIDIIERSILQSENEMINEPDNKLNIIDYNKINFSNYLYHPNKDALMNKLHEILDNSKGKNVAITIMALARLSYIVGYKSNKILYNSMRKEFGDIGKDSGLNFFQNENNKKLYENDINQVIEILKRVNT